MNKYTYTNQMPFTYDPNHSGAHYFVGGSYKNNGQFAESIAKYHRGLEYINCPATAYNEGSDIEEINASVKSSKFTLGCIYGPTMESILKVYFENVKSTLWIYVVMVDDEITEYHMDRNEFESFVKTWGGLQRESGSRLLKVRGKATSGKMLKWLEERL